MKILKLSDVIGIISKIAPSELAESWDNPGLQLGDPGYEIKRIMVALEPTLATIEEAITTHCQLLITHHPLIFKPQTSISTSTPLGKAIHTAIKANLAVVCMHTNYDSASGGLNDLLAERIGLATTTPLKPGFRQELVKLIVFVPESHHEQLRAALFPFAASLGAYQDCSFSSAGEGTFTPGDTAKPFIGSVGVCEKVAEKKLELLLDRTMLPRAINRLQAVHPYEEPAYDVYPLLNQGIQYGLGRIGKLDAPVSLEIFAGRVAQSLNTASLRYVGNPDAVIRNVALCSGSGASLIRDAVRRGADVLVTGDVKYHDARDAEALGLALIDAGHFGSEIIMAQEVKKRLQQKLAEGMYAPCEVTTSSVEQDPFRLPGTAYYIKTTRKPGREHD